MSITGFLHGPGWYKAKIHSKTLTLLVIMKTQNSQYICQSGIREKTRSFVRQAGIRLITLMTIYFSNLSDFKCMDLRMDYRSKTHHVSKRNYWTTCPNFCCRLKSRYSCGDVCDAFGDSLDDRPRMLKRLCTLHSWVSIQGSQPMSFQG